MRMMSDELGTAGKLDPSRRRDDEKTVDMAGSQDYHVWKSNPPVSPGVIGTSNLPRF